MRLRRLTRLEWQSYCNRVSRQLGGHQAELDVVGLDLGDRVAVPWVQVLEIVYDPLADVFEIALEGVDHVVERPAGVFVEETLRGLVALEIVTADDRRQILRLREPLPLPAPLRR